MLAQTPAMALAAEMPQEIVDEANEKLADSEKTVNEKSQELEDAKKELESGKSKAAEELEKAKQQLADAIREAKIADSAQLMKFYEKNAGNSFKELAEKQKEERLFTKEKLAVSELERTDQGLMISGKHKYEYIDELLKGVVSRPDREVGLKGFDKKALGKHSGKWMAIGIIVAMAVFYYLYNNRSSHLFHSLPLKRTELFISNFLSGICMLVVPVLLAFILGTVCCIMQGITSLQYLLAWALMLTGESFFFYSMAIFVGMFSGQLLAMPVFTIILNVLYIGCRYVITCMISTIGYGMANSYADRMNSILSPVIYLSNKVGVEYDYLEDRIEYHMFGLSVVGIYVLVGVVLIVISCLLYQKRKLETTGDVLTIPATRPVFRWGMAFCVAFLLQFC